MSRRPDDFGDLRYRTPAELAEIRQAQDDLMKRFVVRPTLAQLAYEHETLELRRQFLALDLVVHDDWSLTGCRRDQRCPHAH